MLFKSFKNLFTKSSPESGQNFLALNSTGGQSVSLDDLADAVLDRLTSKTYQLDQGTKNIIQALNELNSKSLLGYKLREKYIENAEIVIAVTTKVIRSGVTFSGTIPIFFYSTDRSGWQFSIFRHQNQYNDWLMALSDSADGTFSGYFYYLEKVS